MVLVDTSVWIDFFNGHPSGAAERLSQLLETNEEIVVPGLVLTEVLCGLRNAGEAARIADLLAVFMASSPLERADYVAAAEIFRTCRTHGLTIRSTIDCLIAQICLRNNYALLSKDRDFAAIARVFPLQCLELS